jgi:hypothetical protein
VQLTRLSLKFYIQRWTLYPYGGFSGHESIPRPLYNDAFYSIARLFSNLTLNFEGQVWAAHMVLYIFLYASGMQYNCSHIKSSSSSILSTRKWRRVLENNKIHAKILNHMDHGVQYSSFWILSEQSTREQLYFLSSSGTIHLFIAPFGELNGARIH